MSPLAGLAGAEADGVMRMTLETCKARDGVVQKLKATLSSESDLTIAGYPGREIKMSAKETDGSEFLIRARIYAVKNRAYFVQFIIGSTDTAPTAIAAATKYFDSFSVSVP